MKSMMGPSLANNILTGVWFVRACCGPAMWLCWAHCPVQQHSTMVPVHPGPQPSQHHCRGPTELAHWDTGTITLCGWRSGAVVGCWLQHRTGNSEAMMQPMNALCFRYFYSPAVKHQSHCAFCGLWKHTLKYFLEIFCDHDSCRKLSPSLL